MLADLMNENGIRKACIVDDANDIIPELKDLTSLRNEWDNLLDDIPQNDDLITAISEEIPDIDMSNLSVQDIDTKFVQVLWSLKEQFPNELTAFFEAYDSTKLSDARYVQTLKKFLEENNFEVTTVGRDFKHVASTSDIIFIDLFLHLDQSEDNIDYTVGTLKDIISEKADSPPIIVLISRSSRLSEYADNFRDSCGLIESGFFTYRKSDLEDTSKLLFYIRKSLIHYRDSVRVWGFLNAWEEHASKAVSDTVSSLKRMDLLDHNMVHKLLLNDEGQSSASYFMELFDSVLLHNFESQADIIDAAKELNNIDFSRAPTIQGLQKEPLQDLVFKSVFMGSERFRINEKESIELGDIFKISGRKSDESDFLQVETGNDNVWLVITPSCDLVRSGVTNIGLIKGTLKPVSYESWSADTKSSTPIIKINDDSFSIKWDIKSFMTYPKSRLQELLTNDIYCRVAKLREVSALGLQQSFTADYSRVGQRAILPSVFKTPIKLAYLAKDGCLREFDNQEPSQGLCYVGARNTKWVNFSQGDCENILNSLGGLDIDEVYPQAKSNLSKILRNPYSLIEAIERGIEIGSGLKDIKLDESVLAKIVIGEPQGKEVSKLKGIGLIFIVSPLADEE
ncbi:hypothetical protein [Alkalimonas mucilaginosa]|uniref:Response receiver domain-containing protein n=1 Tax=Alkalimonas mucilaginosa TaxID=3057676 RepID=A0ABU7JK77_9GAMM|nr:hypothetical protein [Alkalimonas sp. MEB004]MEE2025358.1 hypothetical protein [Alkalimonas sp. MEB004]